MKNNEENVVMLYKLITGDLIVGTMIKDLSKDGNILIKDPVVIIETLDSFHLTRYNNFSKLNVIMLVGRNIVFADLPSDDLVKLYSEFLSSSTVDWVMNNGINNKNKIVH